MFGGFYSYFGIDFALVALVFVFNYLPKMRAMYFWTVIPAVIFL